MSVLLDGKALLGDRDTCGWGGVWYYCREKERGAPLPFTYKRTGDIIPKDLLEYVSFYTANPLSRGKKGKGRGRRTTRNRLASGLGRRRGRPSLSPGVDALKAEAGGLPESGPQIEQGPNGPSADVKGEGDDESEGEGEREVGTELDGDDGEAEYEDGEGDGDEDEEEGEVTLSGNQAIAPEEVTKMLEESSLPAATAAAALGLSPTPIPRGHPLFGVWEGTFDVSPPAAEGDTAHMVPEMFFLHSFLGAPVAKPFVCLPAPAHYSYSALRTAPHTLLPAALLNDYLAAPQASSRDGETGAQAEAEGKGEDPDAKAATVPSKPTTPVSGSVRIKAETLSETRAADAAASAAASITVNAKAAAAATPPANPDAVTDGSGTSPLAVMVGFGRNAFGRFSLTATYDRLTGTLVAEKRYIQSRSGTAQRKGRRSHDPSSSTNPAEVDPMTTRPKNGLLDMGTLGGLLGRRKRASGVGPLGYHHFHRRGGDDFAYGDDEEFYGAGAAATSNKRSKQSAAVVAAAAAAAAAATSAAAASLAGAQLMQGGLGPGGVPPPEEPDPEDDTDYRGARWDEATGEVYEGGWWAGRRNGNGVVLYADGSMFEGQWLNGKECGHGQLMTGDRKVLYSGEWMDGLMHGHGSYNFFSGDRYVGEWREGNRHGKGEFLTRDGCKYVGDWKENRRSGRGVFTWPDGSSYDGEWDEDTRHGKGMLVLSTGFTYEGLWTRNFFEGRGVAVFPNGQKYEGSYRAGLREGRGSITFPEGAIYEGRFRDDRLDGQGTIKILHTLEGGEDGELMVPLEIQADMRRIHLKAGFGEDRGHH